MQFITIDNSLAAKGSLELKEVPFFSLAPGSLVKRIGDGRENGCVRTDTFTVPFRYAGAFEAAPFGTPNTYYAFEVPKELCSAPEPHYLLYGSTGLEAIRETKTYYRFLKPEFEIVSQWPRPSDKASSRA